MTGSRLDRRRRHGPPAAASLGTVAAAPAFALLLAGCSETQAPTLALFGAYFPSWLAAALAGILGAVLVRFIFIPLGIDDALPVRLPVYLCIAAAIGFAASMLVFGR